MASRLRDLPRRHPITTGLTALVVLALLAAAPPLEDPLGAPLPDGWRLHHPAGYLLLAPLATLWDQISLLPLGRLTGLLWGLGLAFVAGRVAVRWRHRVRWPRALRIEAQVAGLSLAGFVVFVLAGMAWRTRPMPRLVGLGPDALTVEIHSHTNASHDARGGLTAGFDALASQQWHARAGVDVLFITDHNTTLGWERFRGDTSPGETQVCPGIELSAHGAHVIVLGAPLPPSQQPYRGSAANRARLFAEVAATPGAVAIASLPEYRGEFAQFAAEGAAGFEIVSGSPKGAALTRAERDSVIALARRLDLVLLAAGDQHGYGATPVAWNVVSLPGWRQAGGPPCAALVERFRSGGPGAARIAARPRLADDHPLPGVLTPLAVAWRAWGSAGVAGALSWLAWLWAAALGAAAWRRRSQQRREAAVQTLLSRRP